MCVCVYKWNPCCTPETNTTLSINCMSIEKKKGLRVPEFMGELAFCGHSWKTKKCENSLFLCTPSLSPMFISTYSCKQAPSRYQRCGGKSNSLCQWRGSLGSWEICMRNTTHMQVTQCISMCFGGKCSRGDSLSAQGVGLVILNRRIRVDFPKKVTFEPRLEEGCRVCCFAR